MTVNYQIRVKAKNHFWYEQAKDFPDVESWEKWDEEKTPRYIREIAFKFKINVKSFEPFENISTSIICVDENQDPVPISIPNLRVIKFHGEIVCDLIISESILEQVIIEKKQDGKTYFNCYIKENVVFQDLAENIWLSEEHLDIIKKTFKNGCTFLTPVVELINFKARIPIYHDNNSDE